MNIQAANPAVGFESSNHYLYCENNLLEKLLNINYLCGIMNSM
jgi:hypothetical protein